MLKTTGQDKQITVKRVRCKNGLISTNDGNININSYVEGYDLDITTVKGSIRIAKKLGITSRGSLTTKHGNLSISSVYSLVNLLPKIDNNFDEGLSVESRFNAVNELASKDIL